MAAATCAHSNSCSSRAPCSLLRCSASARRQARLQQGDLAAANTLRERALADTTAYRLVESLTTEVGPRPAGSAGDKAAVAWALREMQRLGFANVRTMDVIVPHWVRGDAEFAVLAPWPQPMPTLALGGSVGTARRRHRGRGRHGQGPRGADGASGRRGEGQDRLLHQSHGAHARRLRLRRAVAVRATGPADAAALGALGVVIRSVSTSNNRFPHTGATRYTRRRAAHSRHSPSPIRMPTRSSGSSPAANPYGCACKSSSRELPPERSANVIGEIPGTDRANEIVHPRRAPRLLGSGRGRHRRRRRRRPS